MNFMKLTITKNKLGIMILLFFSPFLTYGAKQLPNIVFILADDLGLGDVSIYNTELSVANTVHMDKLARGGMRFTNAHTSSAICSPTRYGLMMGEHPMRVNKLSFQQNYDDVWLPDSNRRTVANVLKDAGYSTYYSGKWHLGFNIYDDKGEMVKGASKVLDSTVTIDWSKGMDHGPSQRGFEKAFGHTSSADIAPYKYFENGRFISSEAFWITGAADAKAKGMLVFPSNGSVRTLRSGYTDTNWDFNEIQNRIRNKAVSYIKTHTGSKPFFLYVPLSGPHTPHVPSASFRNKTPHAYTDYVLEVDSSVGAIVTALKETGKFKNTLIFVTSDNGAAGFTRSSDHRSTGILNGVVLKGEKTKEWEGGHRVPFIAHWGDGTNAGSIIKPGKVTNELISLQDFYKTAAVVAGVKVATNEGVDSWNILPSLLGNGTDLRVRESQFSVSGWGGKYVIAYKDSNGVEWKAIYDKNEILNIKPFDQMNLTKLQLYNLSVDLAETSDLVSNGISTEEREVLKDLHDMMYRYVTTKVSNTNDPNTMTRVVGLTSPRLNENWARGAQKMITWYSIGSVADVKIQYSEDNGSSWKVITNSVSSAPGSYNWKVSSSSSNKVTVRVSTIDGKVFDEGTFSLVGTSVARAIDMVNPLIKINSHQISISESGSHRVKVRRIKGELVASFKGEGENNYSLNLSQAGLYIVTVETKSGKMRKIISQSNSF